MRVGATIFNQNYNDWDRYEAEEQGRSVPKRAARSDREIFHEELNVARMADDLGFDSVWTIEHHFTPYTMVTNPLQYLTYIAGITKHVDLGTMVTVLPWHNPVRVAEDVNMLDAFLGSGRNVICGVGFIGQGFDVSSYYRRGPDADNPRAAFIFEGVADEIIGNFGLIGGGAAGIEIDCITTSLGSPPNMLRLASSEDHSPMILLVNEEFGVVPPNLGGDQNERVRADLAFGETPAGGALFATSSIAWCGSLSHNGYDNNISRITANVLKRFLDPTPFT